MIFNKNKCYCHAQSWEILLLPFIICVSSTLNNSLTFSTCIYNKIIDVSIFNTFTIPNYQTPIFTPFHFVWSKMYDSENMQFLIMRTQGDPLYKFVPETIIDTCMWDYNEDHCMYFYIEYNGCYINLYI